MQASCLWMDQWTSVWTSLINERQSCWRRLMSRRSWWRNWKMIELTTALNVMRRSELLVYITLYCLIFSELLMECDISRITITSDVCLCFRFILFDNVCIIKSCIMPWSLPYTLNLQMFALNNTYCGLLVTLMNIQLPLSLWLTSCAGSLPKHRDHLQHAPLWDSMCLVMSATPSSLPPVKSRMVYLSGAGLPRLSWEKSC